MCPSGSTSLRHLPSLPRSSTGQRLALDRRGPGGSFVRFRAAPVRSDDGGTRLPGRGPSRRRGTARRAPSSRWPGSRKATWIWVDAVEPSLEDLTAFQQQLDLHDLAVEDVQHRNQRPKLDLYPGHAFAVFRPLSLGAGRPRRIRALRLRLAAIPRDAPVPTRLRPREGEAAMADRCATLAPGTGSALYADRRRDRGRLPRGRRGAGGPGGRARGRGLPIRAGARAGAPRCQLEILRLRTGRGAAQAARDPDAAGRSTVSPTTPSSSRRRSSRTFGTSPTTCSARSSSRTVSAEILTTVVDIRMAQSAHQLNEVMKKLTAWAGIILVPTLIAGIYGMNFRPHAGASLGLRLPPGARD